jgi:hypothetical protein
MIAMISFMFDLQKDRDGIHRWDVREVQSEMHGQWMTSLPWRCTFLHENFINAAVIERPLYPL